METIIKPVFVLVETIVGRNHQPPHKYLPFFLPLYNIVQFTPTVILTYKVTDPGVFFKTIVPSVLLFLPQK